MRIKGIVEFTFNGFRNEDDFFKIIFVSFWVIANILYFHERQVTLYLVGSYYVKR